MYSSGCGRHWIVWPKNERNVNNIHLSPRMRFRVTTQVPCSSPMYNNGVEVRAAVERKWGKGAFPLLPERLGVGAGGVRKAAQLTNGVLTK